MGLKSAPACCSYSCVMVSLLGLALILPMLFITTAIVKLDSIDQCIDGGKFALVWLVKSGADPSMTLSFSLFYWHSW